jgi:DNA polymerase delta subunit 2
MLSWRHVAPTAPDTLGCYAFMEEDPFVILDCPHVFYAGNQAQFGSSLLEGADGQKVSVVSVELTVVSIAYVWHSGSSVWMRTLVH